MLILLLPTKVSSHSSSNSWYWQDSLGAPTCMAVLTIIVHAIAIVSISNYNAVVSFGFFFVVLTVRLFTMVVGLCLSKISSWGQFHAKA
jgi:hypothetical protein